MPKGDPMSYELKSGRNRVVLFLAIVLSPGLGSWSRAQTSPSTAPAPLDATQAIAVLRQGLIDSFNNQDIDTLVKYLAPDVVVTWQNGEVSHGPAELKAYYLKMMKGDHPIVAKITSDPKVDGRQIYGDWAVSYGHMNDRFLLTDGSDLLLDSRFTATISRQGDQWLITAFHLSTNTFDNPVLGYAGKKGATYGALGGGAGGLVIGLLIGVVFGRKRKAVAIE
jgi:ketosteroid isomerase-like protein